MQDNRTDPRTQGAVDTLERRAERGTMDRLPRSLACLCCAAIACAAGWPGLSRAAAVPSARAVALLKAGKPLWSYLGATLEFHPDAQGVRLGAQWKKLAGTFIGPYQVAVKPKGEKNHTLTLVVETEQKFVDAAGRELAFDVDASNDDIFEQAVKVEETVTSVRIVPGVEPPAPAPAPAATQPVGGR